MHTSLFHLAEKREYRAEAQRACSEAVNSPLTGTTGVEYSTEAEIRKFEKFAAKLRTDMELVNKSKIVSEKRVNIIREQIAHSLVSRNLIYPPTLQKLGITHETALQEKKDLLQIEKKEHIHNEYELKFIKFMEESQQKANQSKWRFRIAEHAAQMDKENWYPFFVTLTVDPKVIDSKEMWQSGKKWQSLVKRLSKVASKELGHPPFWKKNKDFGYRPITDYLHYAAIIEHGKSREHHHLHAMVWLREIPSSWKLCPNRHWSGIRKVHNRCRPLETLWKLGRTEVNYFRSVNDIWSRKHNFSLPLKNGKPMPVAPINAAGAYLTKYLQKDHKEWLHRLKATRNLGLTRIKNLIKSMTLQQCKALTWRPKTSQSSHSLKTIHIVPLGLVRQIAKQVNFVNHYRQNLLDLKTLTMQRSKPYIRMLRSARGGARPDRMPFQGFYDWVSELLPEETEYCDSQLLDSH